MKEDLAEVSYNLEDSCLLHLLATKNDKGGEIVEAMHD